MPARLVSAQELLAQGLSESEVQKSLLEQAAPRFWAKVNKTATCWLWLGAKSDNGYGHFAVERKRFVGAHRIAYMLVTGTIPVGWTIDHLCRVRSCVNPAHLEAVPFQVNVARGMSPAAKASREGCCCRGHLLIDPNVVYFRGKKRNSRTCRICRNAWKRRAYAHQRCSGRTDADLVLAPSRTPGPRLEWGR